MNGFLALNKPEGISSHQAVGRIRRLCGVKKVGHTGTLDPAAGGLLLVAIGKATRLSEYFLDSTKAYRAVVHFGSATDTYDREGNVQRSVSDFLLSRAQINAALSMFQGEIMQKPPAASALKVQGKRAYELFRSGQTPDLPPRKVTIYDLQVVSAPKLIKPESPQLVLDIECSKGTYIRSLANDLGDAVKCPAHLAGLLRTKIGSISLAQAVELDDLDRETIQANMLDMAVAVTNLPRLKVGETTGQRIAHGLKFKNESIKAGPVALFCNQQLIGIGDIENYLVRPVKVLV
ncbi:MAG: tRNA pseudouridine(55) synthase TruB [Firmicutes bacterium]|nr:tRNA pseudouridine(55) synthase TruB [Bacillota bacterium]